MSVEGHDGRGSSWSYLKALFSGPRRDNNWPPSVLPLTVGSRRTNLSRSCPGSPAVPTPELPPIEPDLHRRLTEDILRRGVLVPILQAEDGEVLDGKVRLAIAEEHGLFCPRIIVGKLSRAERGDLRVAVNLYRRHLSREQARHLVEWALRQEPEASDRRVASRSGVDHKTVGAARRRLEAIGEIPQYDARSTLNGRHYPAARKP